MVRTMHVRFARVGFEARGEPSINLFFLGERNGCFLFQRGKKN